MERRHAHTSVLPMACCHAPWTSLGTYTLWGFINSINSLDCRSRGMPMSSRGASCSSMRRHPSGSATPAVKHTYAHIYTHAYTHTPIHTRLYTRAYTQRQCICHLSRSVTLLRCVTLYPTTCLQPCRHFFLKKYSRLLRNGECLLDEPAPGWCACLCACLHTCLYARMCP